MKFQINKYLIDDIINSEHPSDFEVTKEYAIFILRLPYIKDDKVKIISYAFLIKEGNVYEYCRSAKDFVQLGDFATLHNFLDVRVDKILAKISRLHTKIEKMEDMLYEDTYEGDFAKDWIEIKKELSLIERLMAHAMIAFSRFIKHYKDRIDELAYKDLEEHIERSLRFCRSGMEKLDNLYSFYRTRIDERMNMIMFILTIISAIFLPMTLVTGFFGMNTGGLPYTQDPLGTWKVTLFLVIFEIPFVYFIWRLMKKS
ncbi:magnesium transporter CorA family protein [Nitratiruptor sp. YY09-18]|uniref:magnesium transporter CorA family protein n=1 Tax=Nitratiruptor sp. YY09-18 TaxID=2724901 RepID=UPI0019164467|nr:CorA family divalent cation transporter [Nitratiruptor sp. YY09-18]BCD68241.1 magnesium transporter [Nitratiruptor sp. YY09-18]